MPISSLKLSSLTKKKVPDMPDIMMAMKESSSSQKLLPTTNASTLSPESANLLEAESQPIIAPTMKKAEEAKKQSAVLNFDEENEITVTGYRLVFWKWIFTMLIMLCSAGLLWLLLYWMPKWKLWWTHRRVSLDKADTVLIEDEYKKDYKRYYVEKIRFLMARNSKSPTSADFISAPSPDGGNAFRSASVLRYFYCKRETYLWDEESASFFLLRGLDHNSNCEMFYQQIGLSYEEQAKRALIYGSNDIIVPNHSIGYLLVTEVLNPFYIFQVASVILWTSDEYYYYAAAIVLMSVSGIVSSVYQTKQNEDNLRSTILSSSTVEVQRADKTIERISSSDLVPGDVIVLPSHGKFEMSCDAVLILGNVIVNEAMLTGESVPVMKTPISRSEDEIYEDRKHGKHTLLCGTEVIQTRSQGHNNQILAVVIRTGFSTTKGNLVRSIMFPAPVDFKFEEDSYRFVGFLTLVAGLGFAYTCYRLIAAGEKTASDIFLDAADLITIVIPPALPAAMTIGSIYAQKRLKEKGIFCISPRTINVSGSVQCVCFDKTGTLTEDGLNMLGIVPASDNGSKFQNMVKENDPIDAKVEMIKGMATCHSLTIIDEKLSGDPIDLRMFEFTRWSLEEGNGQWQTSVKPPTSLKPNDSEDLVAQDEIAIVKQYQFSSDHQSMSVIVRDLSSSSLKIFCKGSPEKMKLISNPESIPDNFQTILNKYTESGYRVIALATRQLPPTLKMTKIDKMDRSAVEKDLNLLGLIVFENRIKNETKPVIEELHRARVRTIMVTGDHIQTALSVARECKMILNDEQVIAIKANLNQDEHGKKKPSIQFHKINNNSYPGSSSGSTLKIGIDQNYTFATDGPSFNVIRDYFPEEYDRLCTRGTVFARMTPDQKEFLIEGLQELGYYVGMCGDGANDCGALKAAHAGISLSDAEASVAAPFTSKHANITCVPELIREGRAALITSFGIFKYMSAYSLTQYSTVIILYEYSSNLTDLQYLYIDLFLITVFAFFFGLTKANEGELAKRPPNNSLIHMVPILSLMLQLVTIVGFQLGGLFYTEAQPWFIPFDPENPGYNGTSAEQLFNDSTIFIKEEDNFACWENYAVFAVSAFQYIILAYVFSKSKPYRKWVFTNVPFVSSLIVLTGVTTWLVVDPSGTFQNILELFPVPSYSFRWSLVGLAAANAVVSVFLEDVVMEKGIQKCWKKYGPTTKTKYSEIESWISSHMDWPTLSSADGSTSQNQDREMAVAKKYPFTVEVIDESEIGGVKPTLDFSPQHHHADAANILNSIDEIS